MAGTSPNTQKAKLVASFMQFLSDELGSPQVTEDAKESIEGENCCCFYNLYLIFTFIFCSCDSVSGDSL